MPFLGLVQPRSSHDLSAPLGTMDQGAPPYSNNPENQLPTEHVSCYCRIMKYGDREIKQDFIRQVFVLLTVQLPVVLIMMDMLRFVRRFKSYVATYAWIIGAPVAVFFISLMVLIWFGKIRIKNPWDLIALGIIWGGITAVYIWRPQSLYEPILILIFKNVHNIIPIPYSNEDILIPLGITAALLLVVLIFSIKIKCNVTSYFWVLFAFLMALLTTEILSTFIETYILDIIFSFLEVLLFTCLLALTTQLIWENRLQTLSNFEYTLAAGTFFFITLLMYFDILNIVIVLKD